MKRSWIEGGHLHAWGTLSPTFGLQESRRLLAGDATLSCNRSRRSAPDSPVSTASTPQGRRAGRGQSGAVGRVAGTAGVRADVASPVEQPMVGANRKKIRGAGGP